MCARWGAPGLGENTQKPSIFPQAPRMPPKSGARTNKCAPPFGKKGGGQGARAPSGGACADTGSKRSAEKRTALDTPKQQAQWGGARTAHQQQARPQGEKTAVSGCFSRPRRPEPRTAPPQRPSSKRLAHFSFPPPPPPRQRHPTVRKNLKRPPVRASGVLLWVGPFCWEGCAYTGPWLRIKVSIGWSLAGFGFFCRRETGNAGWGWGKCGGS